MAETNYLIFNEENSPDRTYNDSEYKNATQRLSGVIPGMALSRQHNKMYFQWSAMCKAIADFLVSAGHDCMDNNVEGITEALQQTINSMTGDKLSEHNVAEDAHSNLFAQKLDKAGGTLIGDLNASGHNITAAKFIGDLQGNADTATNAENADYATNAGNASNANNATYATTAENANNAVKATQDSAGQQIDTTYVKDVTSNGSTLTVTKGNGSTSKVTVNNVANATNANVVTEKAITGNTLASALPVGMTWSKVYNNGFPCAYGNCLSIRGAGAIQIVTEWSDGDATPANMYYRNARDSSIDKWSAWRTVAHTGGTISNATTASKLGTGTVGSGVKPIYLNAGSPAASGSTVGNANRPIYMNGGTLSQCSIDLSTLAPKASPALTGSPTAPTQGTSDNSTKLATTAFVRNLINQFKNDGTLGGIVGSSLSQNGWAKFSNGLILQWGTFTPPNGSHYKTTQNFNISFSAECYYLRTVIVNTTANIHCDYDFQIVSLEKNNFTIFSQSYDSVNVVGMVKWFAIGK